MFCYNLLMSSPGENELLWLLHCDICASLLCGHKASLRWQKKKNNPTRQREPSFQPFPSTSFGLWPAGEHFPDQSHFRASIGFPSGACLYAVGSCRSLNLRQPCPSLENTHCSKTNDWGNCFPSVSHQHTTQNYLTQAKRGPHFYSLAGHLNVNGGWLDCTATCAKEYADRMENCRRKEEKVASMKKRFARESKLDVENRERKCWAKAGRKTMICGDTRVAVWSARTSFNLPMPSRWDSVCAMCVRECVLHNHLEWFSSQPEQTGTPDRPPPPIITNRHTELCRRAARHTGKHGRTGLLILLQCTLGPFRASSRNMRCITRCTWGGDPLGFYVCCSAHRQVSRLRLSLINRSTLLYQQLLNGGYLSAQLRCNVHTLLLFLLKFLPVRVAGRRVACC